MIQRTSESSGGEAAFYVGDDAVEAAMRLAAQDAVRHHQRFNVPLVEWRDGTIVHTPPESIELSGDESTG